MKRYSLTSALRRARKVFTQNRGRAGFVYFVHSKKSKLLKIGFSVNPKSRLRSIQKSWNRMEDAEMIGSIEGTGYDEAMLHVCFWRNKAWLKKRIDGGSEYFIASPALLHEINTVLMMGQLPPIHRYISVAHFLAKGSYLAYALEHIADAAVEHERTFGVQGLHADRDWYE